MRTIAPQADEMAVASLESRIGAALPADYRQFLLRYNGGVPDNSCFKLSAAAEGSYQDSVVHYFFGIADNPSLDIGHYFDVYVAAKRVPPNMLPIGRDPGGNMILLSLRSTDHGYIYFWDHELEGLVEDPAFTGHLVEISRSFQDFVDGLTAEDQAGIKGDGGN